MNALLPSSDLTPHRLTVDELLRFELSGAFDGLPRMELLDGVLYEMSPQRAEHVVVKTELGFRLRDALASIGSSLTVLIEPTIQTDEATAPEPDIGIMSQRIVDGYYPASLVRLAIEVSSTTRKTDLGYKREIYGRAGIPEYWVIDLIEKVIHQFAAPIDGAYPESKKVAVGYPIESITVPKLTVSTANLI